MSSTTPTLDPRAGSPESPALAATPVVAGRTAHSLREPAYQGYLVLRTAFVVAPILLGLDKFFNRMTYWPKYLLIGVRDDPRTRSEFLALAGAGD